MPTQTRCPACDVPLQVPTAPVEWAARCPSCRAVFLPTPDATASDDPSMWAEPAPGAEIEICPDCRSVVSPEDDQCRRCGCELESDTGEPHVFTTRRDLEPGRGGLILALGVIGIALNLLAICCFPSGPISLGLGITAWVMGTGDLRRIDRGELDPLGRSTTSAGKICGIVATVIGAFITLIQGLMVVQTFWQ